MKWFTVFLAIISINAFAETVGEKQAKEIAVLKQKVVELEQRIQRLEAQGKNTEEKVKPKPEKKNEPELFVDPWTKLKKGLTKTQVEETVGKPSEIDHFGNRERWWYSATSRLEFDKKGILQSWLK